LVESNLEVDDVGVPSLVEGSDAVAGEHLPQCAVETLCGCRAVVVAGRPGQASDGVVSTERFPDLGNEGRAPVALDGDGVRLVAYHLVLEDGEELLGIPRTADGDRTDPAGEVVNDDKDMIVAITLEAHVVDIHSVDLPRGVAAEGRVTGSESESADLHTRADLAAVNVCADLAAEAGQVPLA